VDQLGRPRERPHEPPAVLEAAVFAAEHPKWGERPLAAVVFKPGRVATSEELRGFLEQRFAHFWIPDEILAIDAIPRTSVGKFLKSKLRQQFGKRLLAP
jgi:fatty-acyl-CoA synthase